MKYYRYFLTILITLLLIHLLISFVEAKLIQHYYLHTLVDVRQLDECSDRYTLLTTEVQNFLMNATSLTKKPVIEIIGSSVSYGYLLPVDKNYGFFLQKSLKNYFVINASIIDASGSMIYGVLQTMQKNHIKVDTLVIELNLNNIHLDNEFDPDKNTLSLPSSWLCQILDKNVTPYFGFWSTHLFGIDALRIMDLKRVIAPAQADNKFSDVNLPNNYFESYDHFMTHFTTRKKLFTAILHTSQQLANHVYFFISPIATNKLQNDSYKDIKKEVNVLNKFYKTRSTRIHCLNVALSFRSNYFINITHLNEFGHQALAQILAHEITKNQKE